MGFLPMDTDVKHYVLCRMLLLCVHAIFCHFLIMYHNHFFRVPVLTFKNQYPSSQK